MVVWHYLRNHWIVYGLVSVYGGLLLLNALGIPMWLPACPIKSTTGFECLGCGLNRAAIALLRLDLQAAAHHNPLVFVYTPVILMAIGFHFYRYWTKLNPKKP